MLSIGFRSIFRRVHAIISREFASRVPGSTTGTAALIAIVALWISPAASTEIWTIASESFFPPYNYTFKGRRVGVDTEIVEAMLKLINVTPVHQAQGWNEVVRALDGNKVDVAFQFLGTGKRAQTTFLIGPYRTGVSVLMVRRNSKIEYEKPADLVGKRIGIVEGYDYGPEFENTAGIRKLYSSNNMINFRRLLTGRVDAIVGDKHVLLFNAEYYGQSERIKVLPKPILSADRFVAVPKARPEKAARLKAAFERIKADGTLAEILARWNVQ